jgi:hypothetical protein
MTWLEKLLSKIHQLRDFLIVCISSVKRLLEIMVFVIGVVFGIHSIGNHKQLHKLKQSMIARKRMFSISLDLFECLSELQSSSFEFDMYQWQSIDQNRHIKTMLEFP